MAFPEMIERNHIIMSTTTINAAAVRRELASHVSSSDADLRRSVPTLYALLQQVEAGDVAGGEEINVDRVKLIDLIKNKTDAIVAEFDKAIDKLRVEDENRANYAAALASYFHSYGDAFTSGEYVFDASTGRLSKKTDGSPLPTQPAKPRSESDVAAARGKAEADKAAAIADFVAYVEVLEMGADASFPVQTNSAKKLLATPIPANLQY